MVEMIDCGGCTALVDKDSCPIGCPCVDLRKQIDQVRGTVERLQGEGKKKQATEHLVFNEWKFRQWVEYNRETGETRVEGGAWL